MCGLLADEPQAPLGCEETLRAHRRSEGRSCAAYLDLHDGIFARDFFRKVSRCNVPGQIDRVRVGVEVELRTLIEVNESRMMPSSARQLLRPSRSFSCVGHQRCCEREERWHRGSHLEILELVLICSRSLQCRFEKRVRWPAQGRR